MIPMANDTATLYIRRIDADRKEVWSRVVFRGVVWSQKTIRALDANGTLRHVQQTVLIVPVEVVALVGTAAASFVKPKAYAALNDTQRATAWTLDKGSVIVRGEITTNISDTYKISDLKAANDTYATIQAITDNTGRVALNHWQVEAV